MATSKQKKKAGRTTAPKQAPYLTFDEQAARSFSEEVLAPVMNEFMAKLHATIAAASMRGVQTLFCYRAGLRIFLMYRTWLAARKTTIPDRVNAIKVSRFAALKSGYRNVPHLALTGIGSQLANHDLHEVVEAILGEPLGLPNDGRLPAMPLHEFINLNHPSALRVRQRLLEQSDLMSTYVERLAAGASDILLIDSGWAGTTQLMLEQSLPQYRFEGAYFGVVGHAEILDVRPGKMHGLMFDNGDFRYDPARPETAFVLHRHLIESLFEPDIKTVSQLTSKDARGPDAHPSDAILCRPSCEWDRMFSLVLDDVRKQARIMPTARKSAYRAALEKLTKVLTYPGREDVMVAVGKHRSADLGRSIVVDPLHRPVSRFDGDTADYRIASSLWPAGQAALEFDDAKAPQEKLLASNMVDKKQNYFVSSVDTASLRGGDGKVAVITRTKNRPLLLRRAAASVACQTYSNLEWVVVNDGGDLAAVRDVIDHSLADPSKTTICHNPYSLGMEAASNAGIQNSEGEWIVIHDDDDSWHADFLKETSSFLRQHRGLYAGVITGTMYITEEIVGNTVIEHGRVPYQDWVKSVHLAEMATGNFFAPIAFVFERSVYNTVNGYDPKLPVLGDWDFNLRFLLEADIGVIDKQLAYYHHRPATAAGAYSNSVVGGIDKHLSYNAIVRNKYVRESSNNPKMASLASLISTAYLHVDSRARFDSVNHAIVHSPRPKAQENSRKMLAGMDERWVAMCFMAKKLEELTNGKVSGKDLLRLDRASLTKILQSADIPAPPDFDEQSYLTMYADVAESVAQGALPSGFAHYVMYGHTEGRDAVRK